MSKIHVLIFAAGETNSVELHDALSYNVNVEVYGASSIDRHGGYLFKNYRSDLPLISEDGFIEAFNALIDDWKIDLVFPNHDDIALFLAEHQQEIHAKVIVSSYETAAICHDKKKIYKRFEDCDFCPTLYSDFLTFPVFIKPRVGLGSKGVKLIKSETDIPDHFEKEKYIISEYLPGMEMSVDCLTDLAGNLRACYPRVRNRVLAGICTAGTTAAATDEIVKIAETLNARLDFRGIWFFQIKQDINGHFKLLECATRCSSTMCLTRARGVNLPLLSVYLFMGHDVSVFDNSVHIKMDRVFISRYKLDFDYEYVYIDYDDTVIEKDKVSLLAIRFIYQCRNKGISVVLLTRHESYNEDSLYESLEKHGISIKLFSEIIILDAEDEKYKKISQKNAIFIDNAFKERESPVYDVEGIETLLDWRS